MGPGFLDGTSAACRIAVIGAGGIGNALLPLLVDLRVRKLTIIDGDRVEAHNLLRQPLFTGSDVGRSKASTIADHLRRMIPTCDVVAQDVFLDGHNAEALLSGHDVVMEGVDDLHAKAVIDRTCMALHLPLVSGAVHGPQGQVVVLHAAGTGAGLSRAQLFTGSPGPEQDGCDMRDVPVEVLGEVARCMVARAHDVLQRQAMNGRLEILVSPGRHWMTIEPVR
ncbi:MAG TPA: ThiF family adenylyltransferase [Flavobacteriales bacterium]|nr:ThiF family adenylyltransferase [Flavobacteriales bacterium]